MIHISDVTRSTVCNDITCVTNEQYMMLHKYGYHSSGVCKLPQIRLLVGLLCHHKRRLQPGPLRTGLSMLYNKYKVLGTNPHMEMIFII